MVAAQLESFKRDDLPSFKFYKILNDDSMKLNDIIVTYCSDFKNHYGKYRQIQELCSKYVTYLKKQEDIWIKKEYNNINCNILSYWVSEQLFTTLENDINKCTLAFGEIQHMWSKASQFFPTYKSYKCKPYNSIINFYSKWKEAKYLYDYYIDFDHLKSIPDGCGDKCDDLCEYLNKIDEVYKSFKSNCSHNNENNCPVPMFPYDYYNPLLLINKFYCRKQDEVLDNPETVTPQGEHDVSTLVQDVPVEQLSTNVFQEEPEPTMDESKSLSLFSKSLLGFVLISMLLGVLYKITPIGRQFQNNFPNIANMINKLSKKVKRQFSHRSETLNPFNEYLEENYIGYNPV